MTTTLPEFRYHPDPVATGSVIESAEACERCGQARGYLYKGPIFAEEKITSLCPWCIADGSAAEELDVSFTTLYLHELPEGVPIDVVREVSRRTPGFTAWQEADWLFHCSDAAEYLGRVGYEDVADMPEVIQSLTDGFLNEESVTFIRADGDLTGYLFRCRHCGVKLAYADMA